MKTSFRSLLFLMMIYSSLNAQAVVQNFDNAVGTFFPDPPMLNETFFPSIPNEEMNLFNYSADMIEGTGSMKVDYKIEASEDWGGWGWVVRTTYNVPAGGSSLPYLDLSNGNYLNLWYKILIPANITQTGIINFEFKLAEFNDAGQRELWNQFTNLNLSDNSGEWLNVTIPLKQDVDINQGFVLQADLGFVDGVLQLDKIKGFEIAVSYYSDDHINNRIATGTFLLDALEIGSYDIYLININTGKLERVTKINNADEYNPSFSNNGKQIAHDVVGGNSPLGHSIYITDISSGVSTLLTGAEGGNDASWSPNGNYIAFDRSVVGDASIYIVPAGGGTRTLVRTNAIDAEWSNNSKRLVFTDNTNYSLRTVDLNGGTETVLGPLGINPFWSPDGKYIAYSDGNSIYTIAVNEFGLPKGSPRQITFDGPYVYNSQPSWSNNSKTIVFHSNRVSGNFDLWKISALGGTSSFLTGSSYSGDYDPCYSKNGKYIAYSGFTSATYPVSQNMPKNGELISANENYTPAVYSLNQNYPNPFNPSTVVKYAIPEATNVKIEIFNITGEKVATVVDEFKSEGYYETSFDASGLPTGMYLYRISAGAFVSTKKMILMK